MSSKLEQLQLMLARQPEDPFLLYAVGMEHKKLADYPRAIEHFTRAIQVDPGYCYAYYQRGQVQELQGDTEAAQVSYREGIEAASRTNDSHAKSELEEALAMIQ